MAWGAAATGTPSATGSTGQGLSLMQESLSELCLARIPLVVLNMARAQGDYWQATRGPGHGDAAHAGARADGRPRSGRAHRSSRSTSPSEWRNPVLVFGDYYLAHTSTLGRGRAPRLRARRRSTTGRSTAPPAAPAAPGCCRRSARRSAASRVAYDLRRALPPRAPRTPRRCSPASSRWSRPGSPTTPTWSWSRSAPRRSTCGPRSPACGPTARASGSSGRSRCCRSRPRRSPRAARGAQAVAVYENNQGQMVDDVRLAVPGSVPVAVHRPPQPRRLGVRHRTRSRRRRTCATGSRSSSTRGSAHERALPPHRRAARRSRRTWSTTSPRRSSTSASTACARAAASRSPCAPSSRRIEEVGAVSRAIGVFGIGCYTAFSNNLDVEVLQALHGRAPSLATGRSGPSPTPS